MTVENRPHLKTNRFTAIPNDRRDRLAAQLNPEDFQIKSIDTSDDSMDPALDFSSEEDPVEANVIEVSEAVDLDHIGEQVDLSAGQMEHGEMNEEDARETGYLREDSQKDL